jgi:fimbrial protein
MCSQVLWINQRKPDIRLNIAWHGVGLALFDEQQRQIIPNATAVSWLPVNTSELAFHSGNQLTAVAFGIIWRCCSSKSASPTPLLTGVSPGLPVNTSELAFHFSARYRAISEHLVPGNIQSDVWL